MVFVSFSCYRGARRDLHSFPTRRSSDLVTSAARGAAGSLTKTSPPAYPVSTRRCPDVPPIAAPVSSPARSEEHSLNSSHVEISYAVFCLKKKKFNCQAETSIRLDRTETG